MRIRPLLKYVVPAVLMLAWLCCLSALAEQKFYGAVSTTMNAVRVAGEEVFPIQTGAGGFTALERSIIVERNINDALMGTSDRSPECVEVVTINHLPVVRIAGKHVVTADTLSAKIAGMEPGVLAGVWADSIRKVLGDRSRVDSYVSQLSGDFLYSPYSPPFRRAQYEAGRINHAANLVRADMGLGVRTSCSVKDEGMTALMKRDYTRAADRFREAIALEPRNARAHYGLGVTLMKLGNIDAAINELQLSRWFDPDDANVHLALGECLESKGLAPDALAQYREAALIQPDNPEAYLYIADLREERNDIGKSVAELTAAEKIMPNSQYISVRKKDQLTWRLIRPY